MENNLDKCYKIFVEINKEYSPKLGSLQMYVCKKDDIDVIWEVGYAYIECKFYIMGKHIATMVNKY